MVMAACESKTVKLNIFHVVELIDGEDGGFQSDLIAYMSIQWEGF